MRGTPLPSRAADRRSGDQAAPTAPAPGAARRRAHARTARAPARRSRRSAPVRSPHRRVPDASGSRPRCSRCVIGTSYAPSVWRRTPARGVRPPTTARPARPPRSATVSHPSRSSRSFTARHHALPGGDASSGSSTPRRACQRINDNAARRNGRCRGARPVGPWNTHPINARRAAGSSRTAATCA